MMDDFPFLFVVTTISIDIAFFIVDEPDTCFQ